MNKNSKILLTIINRGELGATVSNASSKEVVSKIKSSPFEIQMVDAKGIPTGLYLTPKGHYKAPNVFNERGMQACTRKVNISGDAVMHFISNDSCPFGIKKFAWEKFNETQRIEAHLRLNAEGLPFTYEVIE